MECVPCQLKLVHAGVPFGGTSTTPLVWSVKSSPMVGVQEMTITLHHRRTAKSAVVSCVPSLASLACNHECNGTSTAVHELSVSLLQAVHTKE